MEDLLAGGGFDGGDIFLLKCSIISPIQIGSSYLCLKTIMKV